jgi:hypothetical protein
MFQFTQLCPPCLKRLLHWVQARRDQRLRHGPVEVDPNPKNLTNCERIFDGCYALFSNFILATAIGFLVTPVFHRLLHYFHIHDEDA